MSTQCEHGFGAAWEWPSLFDLFTKKHPAIYTLLIPLSIVGFGITAAASMLLLFKLYSARQRYDRPWPGQQKRSSCLFYVAAAPFSMAFLKLVSVLSPRAWKVLNLCAALVEGVAFLLFLELILSFLEAEKRRSGKDSKIDSSEEAAEEEPLPASLGNRLSPGVVRTVRGLVWQFVLVVVLVAIIDLDDIVGEKFNLPISALETVSLICCVVAELVLIHRGGEVLRRRRAHGKFWTMKLLFVLNTLAARIVSRRYNAQDVWVQGLCYPGGSLAAAWSGTITTLVAAPVALLARCVFLTSDLAEKAPEAGSAATRSSSSLASSSSSSSAAAAAGLCSTTSTSSSHSSKLGAEDGGDIETGKIATEADTHELGHIHVGSSRDSDGAGDVDALTAAEKGTRSAQGTAKQLPVSSATATATATPTALGAPSEQWAL